MSRRESGFRVDKKGTIDLVTEVDLECERMCRAVLAERFPDHDILAEELSSGPGQPRTLALPLGVRPARRHDQLRARPADLLLVAGAGDRRTCRGRRDLRPDPEGAVHRRARSGRVRQRDALASVGDRAACSTRCSSPASRTTSTRSAFHSSRCSAHSSAEARAVRRLGSAALDLCYVAAGRFDGFWEQHAQAVGRRRRCAHRRGSGRPDHRNGRVAIRPRRSTPCRIERTNPRSDA